MPLGADEAPLRRQVGIDVYKRQAKDISKKISSVKHDKQRKGLFIGGKAVYGYKPVSYTHLDVYKRQVRTTLSGNRTYISQCLRLCYRSVSSYSLFVDCNMAFFAHNQRFTPVSYTHLDVYKRQIIICQAFRFLQKTFQHTATSAEPVRPFQIGRAHV